MAQRFSGCNSKRRPRALGHTLEWFAHLSLAGELIRLTADL
jgi:hypothetical protein